LRLSTCVLIESHDEWQVAERRYLSEESMAQLTQPAPAATTATTATTSKPEVIDTATIRTA
ncbi:MAG: IS256 family transposase, partial [Mycobacteriaceae bacterium]